MSIRFSLSVTEKLALLLATVVLLARFAALDTAPSGFYVDEAGGAAHVLCKGNAGTNYWGRSWPLYSQTWGNGRTGPVYFYTAWIWSSIVGGSPGALRALSTLHSLVAVLAAAWIALHYGGVRVAVWALLALALSPWGFHSGRLAWDPPLAPAWLMIGVAFLTCGSGVRTALLAGVAFGLAIHSYPPLMAQVPLLLAGIVLLRQWTGNVAMKRLVLTGIVSALFFAPLLFDGTEQVRGRTSSVSIFGDSANNPTAGKPLRARIPQFFENVGKHLTLGFLMGEGEGNLRHTPGRGVLSWIDLTALAILPLLFGMNLVQKRHLLSVSERPFALLMLSLLGGLSGIGAASLTWESIPHGLRSIGAWPFIGLFSGCLLAQGVRIRGCLSSLYLGIAALFLVAFVPYYYNDFPKESGPWFDTDVREAAAKYAAADAFATWRAFVNDRKYRPVAAAYFEMHYFERPCAPTTAAE